MFYYGETHTGRRLHMGNYIMQGSGSREWVATFCGSEMLSWSEGERPPASRVDSFCKNCFRTYAWGIMTTTVSSGLETVAAKLNDIKAGASMGRWTNSRTLYEIEKLLGYIAEQDDNLLRVPDGPTRIPSADQVQRIEGAA